ncbi:MAG: hypothetical protein EOP42_12995 [Sphingobacteriaceae bacterium]|nr:MAG: hypothetical protein EOP42_12995 [Sphingobacteriaceae bacterium]
MVFKRCFIIFLAITIQSIHAQNLKKPVVKDVTNNKTVEILTRLESHTAFSGKKLTIGIFKVGNGSGSAHVAGNDEISETYYLTVTDAPGDEHPVFKICSIGPFYGSKIISKKDLGDTYVLSLEHFNTGKRSIHKIILSLKKAVYQ